MRTRRCAACKAIVPPEAAYCPGCGRLVSNAREDQALEFDLSSPGRREAPVDAVVQVGARERTRQQLVVIGGVLVLLIVIAVFVGKSRSKVASPPKTTTAPSTTVQVSTVPASTSIVGPDTSAVEAPTTTSSVVQQIAPLSSSAATVVAANQAGDLLSIDLHTGTVTRIPIHRGRITELTAVRGGAFYQEDQFGISFVSLTPQAGSTSLTGVGPYMIGSPDHLGVLTVDPTGSQSKVQYIGADLAAHGPTITVPTGYPVGMMSGGFVVQTNGAGVYRFDLKTGAATRVLAGSYLGSTGDDVAGIVCDDALRCELQVSAGGRVKYHAPIPKEIDLNQLGQPGSVLSPDGKRLAFSGTATTGGVVVLVDLVTGKSITIAAPNNDSRYLAWTPSGESLLWTQAGSIMVWSGHSGDAPVPVPLQDQVINISVA